jgi:hypothetical protein
MRTHVQRGAKSNPNPTSEVSLLSVEIKSTRNPTTRSLDRSGVRLIGWMGQQNIAGKRHIP